jgi:prepilin-type N-terminal cleavage/methylation domain-containing protein
MKKLPAKLLNSGFTLVELLVAISIIGVVSVTIVSSAAVAQRLSRNSQRKADLQSMRQALQQYYVDHGYYPTSKTPGSGSTGGLEMFLMRQSDYEFNTAGNLCQYYQFYAVMEPSTTANRTIICNTAGGGGDHEDNYVVGPL